MITGKHPSTVGLNKFANRRTPSRIGTARLRSITIVFIAVEVSVFLQERFLPNNSLGFPTR
jgi:hypothetical protein